MNTFRATNEFTAWLDRLGDQKGLVRILSRLDAAAEGNFGDCNAVGEGVSEMRIHFGAGYRVYYAREGECVYLLLVGGDKKSQRRDIARAKVLWRQFKGGKS
ncbi:MAG: type II toxin-antitoxin system RelE/ParE family toxin [Thermoguttaceae bacterium]